MNLPSKLAFVDIETTGMNAVFDRIIEIGILRVENNVLVDSYHTLINPQCHVSPFIENLTGISTRDLDNAPIFTEVIDSISEIISDCIFVAHNVRFDYAFLKHEFLRHQKEFSPKHFCTVKLSKRLFPRYKHHNLDSIIERFSLICEKRHRAFDDAKLLWDFYQILQKQFEEKKLSETIISLMKRPSLPISLKQKDLDTLPNSPGVYMFFAQEKTPLYIGKSVNIRDRVLSHFLQDHSSSIEMSIAQQVERIETIQTAGELGALFLESTLVKQLQPHYNRQLRQKRLLTVLKRKALANEYNTVVIEDLDHISHTDLSEIMGIFRSKKHAKDTIISLAKKHNLCLKLFGLEKTKKSCFGYSLGWCKGACKGKELPIKYNLRFTEAFSKYKLKTWPFQSPIIITEYNPLTEKEEHFFIDQWCFLGSNIFEDEVGLQTNYVFDYDTYKILVNYIFDSKNQRNIKKTSVPVTHYPSA